jgi:hypothetical protein
VKQKIGGKSMKYKNRRENEQNKEHDKNNRYNIFHTTFHHKLQTFAFRGKVLKLNCCPGRGPFLKQIFETTGNKSRLAKMAPRHRSYLPRLKVSA